MRLVLDTGSEVRMLEKLQNDIGLGPGREMVKSVGLVTQRTAQRAAKPHAADKGTLGQRLLMTISDGGLTATVEPHASIAGLAFTINYGRRSGKRPPYGPIKRWLESHGYIPLGKGNSKFVQAVRDDIRARGTRGVLFMETAIKAMESTLKGEIPKTEREIQAAWERTTAAAPLKPFASGF